MALPNVLTIEEISEQFRVPEAAIEQEINNGRLTAVSIAGHVRVLEPDFDEYLGALRKGTNASVPTESSPTTRAASTLSPARDFTHTWPAKTGEEKSTEEFTSAHEGRVPYRGQTYHVKVGFTHRLSAGKRRRRSLVLVDRYPTVEFVAPDEATGGKMASIIRDRNGKHVPVGATLPPEYQGFTVAHYNSMIVGAGAASGLAVTCDHDDIDTMIKHALIRCRYREERSNQ
jgi:hypothetical protein